MNRGEMREGGDGNKKKRWDKGGRYKQNHSLSNFNEHFPLYKQHSASFLKGF
jgi:hypothetical protein